MDSKTEFDTDVMILDYTCCKAIHELLLRRISELGDKPPREETDLLLMFNTWKNLISHKHATRKLSRDLQAKLQLISFTALFFFRARQSKWSITTVSTARQQVPRTFSDTDYKTMLGILNIPRNDRLQDRFEIMSLMDLFPDFVSLCSAMSAARVTTSSSLSPSAGDLVGKYLLQSALEQYTLFGKAASDAKTDVLEIAATTMTAQGSEYEECSQYFSLLSPPPQSSLEAHFNQLALQFPAFDFESMIIMQLQDFLFKLDTPVLVKLETGELETV